MASVALLVPLLAVLAGLTGPLKVLPLTSGPDEPRDEPLNSFWRRFMASDDAWLRLPVEAEAQREDRGRKIETRVRTWEDMPGVLTK